VCPGDGGHSVTRELYLVPIPDEQNDIFDSDNNPVYVSDWISTPDPSEFAL